MAHDNFPQSTAALPREGVSSTGRRRWLVGGVAGVALVAGAGIAWWERRTARPAAQPDLWGLSFEAPDQTTLHMRSLAGRPLLLNFWATWCPPCVEELPLLDRFYAANVHNDWQVLGLAVDQLGAVQTFLRRAPLRFPVALAGLPGIELSRSLGNISGGLPFTVVFGASGQVLHRKMGAVTSADLQSWSALR